MQQEECGSCFGEKAAWKRKNLEKRDDLGYKAMQPAHRSLNGKLTFLE